MWGDVLMIGPADCIGIGSCSCCHHYSLTYHAWYFSKIAGDGHIRTYNAPAANEVAALFPDDEDHTGTAGREVRIQRNDGKLQFINDCNGAFMALHLANLFAWGENGEFAFQAILLSLLLMFH